MDFSGKTVLVTGSARGIGKAIARRFADDGANIVISDVLAELADETAGEFIKDGIKAIAIKADVTNKDDVKNLIDETVEKFGSLDVVVNNAGITRDTLLMRMKESDWDLVMNINLKGAFLVTQAASRIMMKQRSGRIVNISSVVGKMGNAGQANYSASKAGLLGLTKSAARELASRNITVNAIAPGFIKSEMTDNLPEDIKAEFIKTTPLGRFGSPEDIANAVAFLASDDASYITGQVLGVDGGMTMY
ncbi:MAG: 3-oxoacyl-[acyl-carrier-protein] reductase [Candidatus Zixiibacteriota bacterium]